MAHVNSGTAGKQGLFQPLTIYQMHQAQCAFHGHDCTLKTQLMKINEQSQRAFVQKSGSGHNLQACHVMLMSSLV